MKCKHRTENTNAELVGLHGAVMTVMKAANTPPPIRPSMQGCQASVVLKATSGNETEKDASPNLMLHGFDFRLHRGARREECPTSSPAPTSSSLPPATSSASS